MDNKLIIFGIGKIGQVVYHHFKTDSSYEVAGFTCDADYVPESGEFDGLPVVAFEEVQDRFDPDSHACFVATGYHDLNRMRAQKLQEVKNKGYFTTSYISTQNKHLLPEQVGENCFIMSGEPLQPCVTVGGNCFIWTNALVGHHSTIADDCWITSGVTIGGHCAIGQGCFLGLGSTLAHGVTLGDRCIIGAGAVITKDVEAGGVYIAEGTPRFRLTSEQFIKMNPMV